MLYIISFQSISCREVSPTSPRPHAAPPEGSSARAEVAGLPIGHPLNLPPDFPHVLSSVLWPVIPSIFHPVSLTLLSSVLWPVFPSIFHPVSLTLLSSVLWRVPQNNSLWVRIPVLRPVFPSVFPSIFHTVFHTLLSSVLWPVPQNNSQAGPRGGLRHGHPAYRYLSAIQACRDVPKPVSERCSERFLRRSSDRLPVRARLFGGRGEKEVSKCLEFRNLRLLQGALDGEGTVQNIDRFH